MRSDFGNVLGTGGGKWGSWKIGGVGFCGWRLQLAGGGNYWVVLADGEVLFQSYPQLHIIKYVGPTWKIAYDLWAFPQNHTQTPTHRIGVGPMHTGLLVCVGLT